MVNKDEYNVQISIPVVHMWLFICHYP